LGPNLLLLFLQVWGSGLQGELVSEAKAASPHFPLYLFLVGTGVRIGEVLGVTWHDLSPREGTVTIAQALQRPRDGGYTLLGPITSCSRVPADWRAAQEEKAPPGPFAHPECDTWHRVVAAAPEEP
jgi:hypothetical protein